MRSLSWVLVIQAYSAGGLLAHCQQCVGIWRADESTCWCMLVHQFWRWQCCLCIRWVCPQSSACHFYAGFHADAHVCWCWSAPVGLTGRGEHRTTPAPSQVGVGLWGWRSCSLRLLRERWSCRLCGFAASASQVLQWGSDVVRLNRLQSDPFVACRRQSRQASNLPRSSGWWLACEPRCRAVPSLPYVVCAHRPLTGAPCVRLRVIPWFR